MTRVTRLIHNAGKYLLISIYPLPTHPTHPTHNFTHKNGANLDTLPGWPKKLHLNRPARCAGQWWHISYEILINKNWFLLFFPIQSTFIPNSRTTSETSTMCVSFVHSSARVSSGPGCWEPGTPSERSWPSSTRTVNASSVRRKQVSYNTLWATENNELSRC